MKKILLILFLLPGFTQAQKIPIIKFDQLEAMYSQQNDTLFLVNYWATWCRPCIQELPHFIALDNELKNKKFQMILVSLDFPQNAETRVLPFLQKKNITHPRVVILDDDANIWINKVHPDWNGEIPVTQIIYKGQKEFFNKTFSFEELKEIVVPKLE